MGLKAEYYKSFLIYFQFDFDKLIVITSRGTNNSETATR